MKTNPWDELFKEKHDKQIDNEVCKACDSSIIFFNHWRHEIILAYWMWTILHQIKQDFIIFVLWVFNMICIVHEICWDPSVSLSLKITKAWKASINVRCRLWLWDLTMIFIIINFVIKFTPCWKCYISLSWSIGKSFKITTRCCFKISVCKSHFTYKHLWLETNEVKECKNKD